MCEPINRSPLRITAHGRTRAVFKTFDSLKAAQGFCLVAAGEIKKMPYEWCPHYD